ncbi:MAG: Bcr/CflA family drug resistance efflux transporter, partial [Pseudooceanicola nanhaiensis]
MTHAPIRFLDRSTPPHIATLVLLTGLGALAMNVFLPSLPKMAEWYAAPYALMQLTVAGFLATNAVMQI